MAAKQEFESRFAKHKDELEWLSPPRRSNGSKIRDLRCWTISLPQAPEY